MVTKRLTSIEKTATFTSPLIAPEQDPCLAGHGVSVELPKLDARGRPPP